MTSMDPTAEAANADTPDADATDTADAANAAEPTNTADARGIEEERGVVEDTRAKRTESRFGPSGSRVVALLVAIGLALLGLIASVAFTVLVFLSGVVPIDALTGPSAGSGTGTTAIVLALAASEIGFALVGLSYAAVRLDLSVRTPTRRETGWIITTVIAALALANGLYALAGALGLDPARSVFGATSGIDPVVYLAIGALSIVLVGPAEELLFRGAIQGRLRKSFGPAASILFASALFASFHVFNFGGGLKAVAFATAIIGVIGAVFGIAYERTGNLAVSILAHGIYNAALTTVAYASAVGWL